MTRDDEISEFLLDYRERCEERGQEPIPEAHLRPVLEHFIWCEIWEEPDPTLLNVAMATLARMLAADEQASPIVGVIQKEVRALRTRLKRQSVANAHLQEQATMLGDALRKLR